MTDVTIAIVNWNTRKLLEDCLKSLPAGTAGLHAQVIVVDNGSRDGSAEMVRRRFPDMTLIANEENLGFARGNNQACALARGRYFLLLNPDTIVRPGAVGTMAEFLDAHTEAAGVTCRLLNLDGSFQRYYKRLPSWPAVLGTFTVCKNLFPENRWSQAFYMEGEAFDRDVPVEQPPATCLMLRRTLFSGSTVLDERFPILFNDIDLCRTLKDRGHTLWFLPNAEVVHYGSGGGVGQMGDEAIVDYMIGLIRYYRKHDGPVVAVALWTLLTINSLFVLLVGFGKVAVGRRDPGWFRHELRRRIRLAIGPEVFRYPPGFRTEIPHIMETA